MSYVLDTKAAFLISGQLTSGGYSGKDMRNAANYAYLEYATLSPSAILGLDASKDNTGWMRVMTVTGTTTTGTAQLSAFYPFVRGVYVTGWSTSASAYMHYTPGYK